MCLHHRHASLKEWRQIESILWLLGRSRVIVREGADVGRSDDITDKAAAAAAGVSWAAPVTFPGEIAAGLRAPLI